MRNSKVGRSEGLHDKLHNPIAAAPAVLQMLLRRTMCVCIYVRVCVRVFQKRDERGKKTHENKEMETRN